MMKKGWEHKKFKDISHSISDGDWIEKKDQSYSGIRLIQTGNIGVGKFIPKDDSRKFITEDTFKRLRCSEIFEGDVLISRLPNPLGRSCILPKLDTRCITAVDCSIVRIKKEVILPEYFIYYTQSQGYFTKINSESSGTTRARITRKKLEQTEIPVPPLTEQQSIVEYLDSSFAKIDTLKANAAKNLDEAKALFQSALKEALEPKKGWEEKTLEEVVDCGTSISYGIVQPGDDVPNGVPVVRPVDLVSKNISLNDNIKRTTKTNSESYKRTILNGKEILMCVRGTTGIVSLTDDSLANCNVTRGIVPLKITDETLRLFVYYTIIAPVASDFIQHNTKGAALKQINIADVKKIPIALPSPQSQQEIVSRLDSLNEKLNTLQQNYSRICDECDTLKQAILRQVFE